MKWCKVIISVFFFYMLSAKKMINSPWFLVPDKIQDDDLFGDVTDPSSATTHKIYLIL